MTITRYGVIVNRKLTVFPFSPMRMHPVISTLLATWIGLGGALAPRFLCVCADGTVSVEFGHEFCCDAESSCGDSCDCSTTGIDTQPHESRVGALTCSGGCQSTPIDDEVIKGSERDYKGHSDLRFPATQAPWLDPSFSSIAFARRVGSVARPPDSRFSSIVQLRSVILLV